MRNKKEPFVAIPGYKPEEIATDGLLYESAEKNNPGGVGKIITVRKNGNTFYIIWR